MADEKKEAKQSDQSTKPADESKNDATDSLSEKDLQEVAGGGWNRVQN